MGLNAFVLFDWNENGVRCEVGYLWSINNYMFIIIIIHQLKRVPNAVPEIVQGFGS